MSFQSDDLIALEAFEHVKIEKCAEYEAAGVEIDNKAQASEPGMVIHALTKVSETETEAVYRWLEVFTGVEALRAHFKNPAVIEHVARMNASILASPTEIVLYTSWSDAEKAAWLEENPGGTISFAPVVAGYYRPG